MKKAHRPAALKVSHFYTMGAGVHAATQRMTPHIDTTPVQASRNGHASGNTTITLSPDTDNQEEFIDDSEANGLRSLPSRKVL